MVKLTGYRNCNYVSWPSFNLSVKCVLGNSMITSKNMSVPVPIDITPNCGNICTRCSNSVCSFPYGIEQYNYTGLVVLNSAGTCCEVRLEFRYSLRAADITTGAGMAEFYNYALLNRCLTPCDNSPQFTNPPLAIACTEQDFVFNNGVQDYDTTSSGGLSDSLTYEWTSPLESLGTPIAYNSGYSYDKPLYFFGFPNAQMAFPRGFHLNSVTGDISFRPLHVETTVMVLKVNEFRKGIKIGEIRRDVALMVISCPTNISPAINTTAFYKEICTGNTVTFNIPTDDLNVNDSLTISWNNGIPGATWTDNNGTTKHPTGTFSWTPPENKASDQPYQFTITVKDNACPIPGSFTQAFRILVKRIGRASYTVADSSCGLYYFRAQGLHNHQPDTFLWNSPNTGFGKSLFSTAVKKLYPGIYPFSLRTSYRGCATTYYDTLTVDSNLPVARLSVNKTSQCLAGNSFTFYDSSYITHGNISGQILSFGDGQYSSNKGDIHSYSNTGTFRVRLLVSSGNGCTDSVIQYVNVISHPDAGFSVSNDKQCIDGNNFNFKDSTFSGIKVREYWWNTGDLSVFKAKDSVYNYTAPGVYHVTHWAVNDSGCADTISKMVIVHPMPVASFSINDSGQCLSGNYFSFTNQSVISSGNMSANWEMGDHAGISKSYDTAYTYGMEGTYRVSLVMTSGDGCTDSVYQDATVYPMPKASFGISDSSGCLEHNLFSMINHSSFSSGSFSSAWEMGDGMGSSSAMDTSYSYLSDGKYRMRLNITTGQGCKDSVYRDVTVYPMPKADFDVNSSIQCFNGNLFNFNNKTSLKYGSFSNSWEFGDMTTDTSLSPSHTYLSDGNYTARLTATSGNGCTSVLAKYMEVRPNPVTDLGRDTTIYDTQSVTLDAGSGFDSYLWSNAKTTRTITVDTSEAGLGSTIFWVRVTKDSCEGYDSVLVTFIHYVSAGENGHEPQISVYPNPASGDIFINIEGLEEAYKLMLTDVFGKQLRYLFLNNLNQNHIYRMDITGLADGIYFLVISYGSSRVYVKVVKN